MGGHDPDGVRFSGQLRRLLRKIALEEQAQIPEVFFNRSPRMLKLSIVQDRLKLADRPHPGRVPTHHRRGLESALPQQVSEKLRRRPRPAQHPGRLPEGHEAAQPLTNLS